MLKRIVLMVALFIGTTMLVGGQSNTKMDSRTLLVELGSMLKEIPESTEQCQLLLKQIKAWQQKKLKELEIPEETCVDLIGVTGSSQQWESGWLDLATPTEFVKGSRLRLKIGGTAAKIIVRLLPKGISSGSPQGIIGGVITVPKSRIVEVSLETDHRGIIQISVHGGPNPWGVYPLGGDNGPATLTGVELCRHNR